MFSYSLRNTLKCCTNWGNTSRNTWNTCAWPRAPVSQGVVIGDQVTAAVVPLHARHGTATAAEARRLFGATLAAYSAAGAHDDPEKRQEDVATAVVWGCEVQGRAGRVGVARAKRAAIAAVTLAIALAGCSSVDLLRRVLGLWTDVLLYRRDVFAVLGAAYHFTNRYAGDGPRTVRSLPGPVRTELLLLAALAPLLDTNIRAPVSAELKVTDSSLEGGCAVAVDVPPAAAAEL